MNAATAHDATTPHGLHPQDLFAALTRGNEEGIWAVDAAGNLLFMNSAAERLLDWTEGALRGTPIHEAIHGAGAVAREQAHALDACPLLQVLRTGHSVTIGEDVFTRRDGRALAVSYTTSSILSEGKIQGAITVFHDLTERQQADATLRVAATIVAASGDAVIGVDREDCIITWNPGAERLYGYSAAEAIGQPVTILVSPEQRDEQARLIERLQRSEHIGHVETVRRHKDGRLIDVSMSVAPITDAAGHVIGTAAIARDISARKRAERELEARARQQAVVAELGQRALASDEPGRLVDETVALVARILDVDHCALLELLPDGTALHFRAVAGWPDEIVGRDLVPTGYESQAGYTLATGTSVIVDDFRTEQRFRANALLREQGMVSGMSVIVQWHGYTYGILSVHTRQARRFSTDDVHFLEAVGHVLAAALERQRAEEQLREKEGQYRSMFVTTTEGIGIFDLNGILVEVNPAACQILGYSYEDMIGRHVAEFIHPDYHHVIAEFTAAIEATGTARAQIVDVRKDGTLIPVDVHGTTFVYNGRPHVLGMLRDITEQVQAYELLEQRVAERTRELSAVLEVSHTVASTLELAPLLSLVLEQLKRVVDYTGAAIFIVEAEQVRVLDYHGPLPEQMLNLRIPLAEAMGYQAVSHHKGPVIVDDQWADTPLAQQFPGLQAFFRGIVEYARSVLVVPLLVKEQVIGVLRIDHRAPHAYTPHHASLAMAFANQVAVAIENARLYTQAQDMAAMEERQRLARELHDSVTQALYGVTLYAEATARLLATGEQQTATTYLQEVRDIAQEALQEMRLLIFELRPPILQQEGLVAALQARLAAVEGRVPGLAATIDVPRDLRLPARIEEALYRIAQETLNNVLKHAKAHTVTVSLHQQEWTVQLEIVDDGIGFDVETAARQGGFGLRGMAERAAQVGGVLTVQSAAGHGATVRVNVTL